MKDLFFVILILPLALPAKVDSPVVAGEMADEVRQKGGAPAEGVSKNIGYGMPRR